MRMAYNNGGRMVTRVYSAVSTAATKDRGKQRAKNFTDEGKATERKHQEDSVTPVLRSERAILHQASSREKEQSLRFAQVYTQSSIRRAKDRKHPRQLQHALCFLAASLVYASLPNDPILCMHIPGCSSLHTHIYTSHASPAPLTMGGGEAYRRPSAPATAVGATPAAANAGAIANEPGAIANEPGASAVAGTRPGANGLTRPGA